MLELLYIINLDLSLNYPLIICFSKYSTKNKRDFYNGNKARITNQNKCEYPRLDFFTLKKSDDAPATNLEVANHYIKQNKSLQEQINTLTTEN